MVVVEALPSCQGYEWRRLQLNNPSSSWAAHRFLGCQGRGSCCLLMKGGNKCRRNILPGL